MACGTSTENGIGCRTQNIALHRHLTTKIWVLDGINNDGFSGGPVLYGTGSHQKISAVISGYVTEPAEVVSSAAAKKPAKVQLTVKTPKSVVNTNSGFIIAYDISWAIDAIHRNPRGRLRVAGSQ